MTIAIWNNPVTKSGTAGRNYAVVGESMKGAVLVIHYHSLIWYILLRLHALQNFAQ